MSNFAPVCPTQILRGLKADNALGNYHLLLAHDVAAKPDEYAEIFDGFDGQIILDNSVIELGTAVDLDMIVAAAKVVRPTTTVLPDVMLKQQSTIEACKAALPIWTEAFQKAGLQPQFMIAPQGLTQLAWVRCAEAFAEDPEINFWSIPRNCVRNFHTRQGLPEILHALNPNRKIHMLGFSDMLLDDVITAKHPYVWGIDSAVPVRAISQDILMSFSSFSAMPPRGNWWETAEYDPAMKSNIALAKQWFKS